MTQVIEAFRLFIESIEAAGRSEHTIRVYTSRLTPFIDFVGEETPIGHIEPEDLDAYMVKRRRQRKKKRGSVQVQGKLSEATIAGDVNDLRRFFRWASNRGMVTRSPASHLVKPKYDPRQKNRAMSPEDFLAIVHEARARAQDGNAVDRRDLAIIALLGDTLARVGEVAKLKTADLSLDRPYEAGGIEVYEAEVNGKTGPRRVSFTEETALYILDWLDHRPSARHGRLFVSLCRWHPYHAHPTCTACKGAGDPMTPSGIRQMLKRMAERAGVEGRYNPHSIRHMGGQLYATEYGLLVAQEKLGHTNSRTTEEFYYSGDSGKVRAATASLSLVSKQE